MQLFNSKTNYLIIFLVVQIISLSLEEEQIANEIDDNSGDVKKSVSNNIISVINSENEVTEQFDEGNIISPIIIQVRNSELLEDISTVCNKDKIAKNMDECKIISAVYKEDKSIKQLNEKESIHNVNNKDKVLKLDGNKIISSVNNVKHKEKQLDQDDVINTVFNEGETLRQLEDSQIPSIVNNNIKNKNSLNDENIISNVNNDDNVQFIQNNDIESNNNETSNLDKIHSEENVTLDKVNSNNIPSNNKSSNSTKYICMQDIEHGPVEIVNSTRFIDIIKELSTNKNKSEKDSDGKMQPGPCILVMFYTTWCVFSSQAAPYFNALPKFFPHAKFMAIDAMKYQHFNSHYGIVGVPTLMLIHDGKLAAKFNDTVYSLETFAKFLTHLTTLQPNGSLHATSADFNGPLSSIPVAETDYCLILSWTFIAVCAMYFMSQSQWWRQFVETVQIIWRESNAQHEHVN